MKISRRRSIKMMVGAIPALNVLVGGCASSSTTRILKYTGRIQSGPYNSTWESLVSQYQCPECFRDARFGMWAQWSAQCVPENSNWYAREMYIQGNPRYNYHVQNYDHPAKFGFIEFYNLWKADKWEPEKLMDLYKRAGAKYFVSMANYHHNFNAYDSNYHAWISVNVGPKKDIAGTWAKIARANGLRFGVSNHSAYSWHWFQAAVSLLGYEGQLQWTQEEQGLNFQLPDKAPNEHAVMFRIREI